MMDAETLLLRPSPTPVRPRIRVGRLRTSNYDISNICNLRCEGCLFFSGADPVNLKNSGDIDGWQHFFAEEAERGINFAYLAGAEPSLTPERIRACHDHIPMGVIFTNGTKRIDADIRYRIHVSVWGSDDRSQLYRGASVNGRAMRNYAGDPRAVFVMTLSNLNLAEIPEIAKACADHGVPLTFSLFSPTGDYNRRLANGNAGDSTYFRFSSAACDMRFDEDGLRRARAAMIEAGARFPGTVKMSADYADWITRPGSLYALDESGTATDCGNRLTHWHRHYNPDMSRNGGKCCSPNLDCRDCRAYAMSLGTYLRRERRRNPSPETARAWQAVWQFWAEMFLPADVP